MSFFLLPRFRASSAMWLASLAFSKNDLHSGTLLVLEGNLAQGSVVVIFMRAPAAFFVTIQRTAFG